MDLTMFLALIGTAITAADAIPKISDAVTRSLRRWALNQRASAIRDWLSAIGALTPDAIRHAVEDWSAGQGRLAPEQREELVVLLVNLSRGARLLTTAGAVRSSFLRCERLLEHLLGDIQPVCRRGEQVSDDWVLERFLGMGSFGEVWMARNPYLHCHNERAYKFFTREEAKRWVLAELDRLNFISRTLVDHPNIVRLLDVGITGRERPYLALEYVEGGSLEDWILEDGAHRLKLDKSEILRGIAEGLAAAHEHGICHRDLKPANVVLAKGPPVLAKITDFGLGKIVDEARPQVSSQLSQVAQVGTTMYLPPEAQEPFADRRPERDDVFALGVLWYQLLVERLERPPYDFAERLRRAGTETHLIRLIERCLAHPDRRFPSAAALLEELTDVSPPVWDVPAGRFDVQYIVREYLGGLTR